MSTCRSCLGETPDGGAYHARCLRRLFRTARLPSLNVELSRLHTAALAMVGHASLSGVQKKISVTLSSDRATLQVAAEGGRYVLKPQADRYQELPENEHLTTCLARLVGVVTGDHGLVTLADGSLAFIIARFDRTPSGRKLHQEDFCQLAELSPREKYRGSGELCARLVRRFASEPLVEVLKLYRLLVFSWWTANGDMHLKNFSLQTGDDGVVRLTPAYDLVCTQLVIPDDPLALSISGKDGNLTRGSWMRFAEYCELPERAANRVLDDHVKALEPAKAMIERSFVNRESRRRYAEILQERTAVLAGTGTPTTPSSGTP